MEKIFKIGLAVIENNKVLLTRESESNKLYIPGGKIEENESDIECLEREIKEELDVKIKKETIKFFGTFEDVATSNPNKIVQIKLFLGKIDGKPKPVDEEIEEIVWFGKNDNWNELGIIDRNKIIPALVKKGLL